MCKQTFYWLIYRKNEKRLCMIHVRKSNYEMVDSFVVHVRSGKLIWQKLRNKRKMFSIKMIHFEGKKIPIAQQHSCIPNFRIPILNAWNIHVFLLHIYIDFFLFLVNSKRLCTDCNAFWCWFSFSFRCLNVLVCAIQTKCSSA